jgi:hypothetical protein
MMRIAVTGSKGQVATALLERAGHNAGVVALGRPAFDLADRAAVLAGLEAARPDVVVNAAAYTAVDKAESEEADAVRVNGEGAGHVAEAAARLNVPLLHLSTDYVFDGALDRAYREDDPTAPTGAYGRSKLAGEKAVAERCENSVILRTAWVYSPFGANFVRTMLRLSETRHRRRADRNRREGQGRFLAGAKGRLSHDRLGGGDLGRFRRSGLRRGCGARPATDPGQAHCNRGLPDPRPAARQFSPRQRKAQSRIRRQTAGMAPVGGRLLRPPSLMMIRADRLPGRQLRKT